MFLLTKRSSNRKTGPIPVSTTTPDSCPVICPLKEKGCYAKGGPLRIVWERSRNALSMIEFFAEVAQIPKNMLWRHNQAGDLLKNKDETINFSFLKGLVKANKGKKGFTYTHHDTKKKANRKAIKFANDNGFTVNLSANSIREVDDLVDLNIGPVVTIVPSHFTKNFKTEKNRVVICPATQNDFVSCATCQLCQKVDREYVIGFPAHSNSKKWIDSQLEDGLLVVKK